jgi:hypothetical protein
MTKVQIVVELTIDDSKESVNTILSEMDYNFSHIIMEESIGKQLNEVELIKKSEILERIN